MYFLELEKATITEQDKRDNIVTKDNLRKLDSWLARTSWLNRDNLSYVKFAREESLDIFTAFCLFSEAKELGVISSSYRVNDGSISTNYDRLEDIPKDKSDSNIELVFMLTAFPNNHPAETPIEQP